MKHVNTRDAEIIHTIEITSEEAYLLARSLHVLKEKIEDFTGNATFVGLDVEEYYEQFNKLL